mgnify:FL=1
MRDLQGNQLAQELRKHKSDFFATMRDQEEVVSWLEGAIPPGGERTAAITAYMMGYNTLLETLAKEFEGTEK